MSVRFWTWSGKSLPVALCATVGGSICLLAQEPASKFDPSVPGIATNAVAAGNPAKHARTGVPVNRLLLLEERINRALKGLSSGSSIEPVAPRSPIPVVRQVVPQAKDQEEERLKQKDWMLLTPEDFAEHEASLELRKLMREGGMLRSPSLSPEEQLLNELGKSASGTRSLTDSLNSRELGLFGESNSRSDTAPAGVVKSEENLRNILQERKPSIFSESPKAEKSLSDFFRSAADGPDRRRPDNYVDTYRQLMAPPQQDFASSQLGRIATDPMRSLPASQGSGLVDQSSTSPLGLQFGSINPVFSPRQPLDSTDQALNQWNRFYAPPAPEPPRSITPPKPNFEAPRRKF